MGPLTLVAFFIACLFGIGYPAIAACLCLGLFPIKQLLQASSGFFRDSLTGSQLINFLIGGVALVAVGRRVVAKSDQFRGYVTSSFILTMLLYVWGVVTCWWSLASAEGFASFTTNIPYIALYLLILPTLVVTIDDWSRVSAVWLITNTIVAGLILANPEFTSWAGRLVLNLGVAGLKITKTNPLEIGAAGGVCIILGLLYQSASGKTFILVIRFIAVLLGTALVVRSGSRGQFLFAIISAIAAYPIARKVKDIRRLAVAAIGLAILLALILFLAEKVRTSGTSDEERRWTSEGFESGSNVRAGNMLLLLGQFASSPMNWVTGLGYQSYYALDSTQEYSHCISVDALAELGLVGATLFLAVFGRAAWLMKQCLDRIEDDPVRRSGLGCLAGILLFYFLLANKQGNLAGSSALFCFVLILERVHVSLSAEPLQLAEDSSSTEAFETAGGD
jgi:hypothetical protein